eukprot:TRINITY_DN1834_c0_g1_i1.p4 TRINITY_DN1834_c0_g1~~TRINITY_DN1834_c0_g1_i1.p4  ORF type:complete len:130 (+),score=1.49 TRINITY_DN1834_c0_g1_i1:374-763(+)
MRVAGWDCPGVDERDEHLSLAGNRNPTARVGPRGKGRRDTRALLRLIACWPAIAKTKARDGLRLHTPHHQNARMPVLSPPRPHCPARYPRPPASLAVAARACCVSPPDSPQLLISLVLCCVGWTTHAAE